jgi:phosphoribosyl-AMP cyclohydrolase
MDTSKTDAASLVQQIRFTADGLVPVVAQDSESGAVLMLAWMNEEAIRLTLATRQVTYWSRSRAALWRKGETSGHTQELLDLWLDCDGDCLLARVRQVGPACHTGEKTCFFNKIAL